MFGIELKVDDISEFISKLSRNDMILLYAIIGDYYEIPDEIVDEF
jgi:hypothetical protein